MRSDYVLELVNSVHERQFPEPKRITDDEQFCIRAFFCEFLQKGNELGRVVAMLQSAVAAHVQVAHEVIFLGQGYTRSSGAAGIVTNLTVRPHDDEAITNQPTNLGVFAPQVSPGLGMACRKCDNLSAPIREECIVT